MSSIHGRQKRGMSNLAQVWSRLLFVNAWQHAASEERADSVSLWQPEVLFWTWMEWGTTIVLGSVVSVKFFAELAVSGEQNQNLR
mmetsp:Transcript_6011/g.13902  ORF Transcript_6011/g.13902 Transcript_6011/m.13902 type:complete len:85 (+) Transcript_6011:288-542(+)